MTDVRGHVRRGRHRHQIQLRPKSGLSHFAHTAAHGACSLLEIYSISPQLRPVILLRLLPSRILLLPRQHSTHRRGNTAWHLCVCARARVWDTSFLCSVEATSVQVLLRLRSGRRYRRSPPGGATAPLEAPPACKVGERRVEG